jgi:hypothetical protein
MTFTMDLLVNFPPGTRFWRMLIDAAADLTPGHFMMFDGSIVSGRRARQLRRRIALDGVEISEVEFRQLAPPSWAEKSRAIDERAKRDLEYAKALKAGLSMEEGLLEKDERVARDAMNAPDTEDRREGAKLLLNILEKKQNIPDQ